MLVHIRFICIFDTYSKLICSLKFEMTKNKNIPRNLIMLQTLFEFELMPIHNLLLVTKYSMYETNGVLEEMLDHRNYGSKKH